MEELAAARFLKSRHEWEARLTRFDFGPQALSQHFPNALPWQSPDPSQ